MIPPSPFPPPQQSAYDAGRWDDAHGIYTELRCLLEPEMRGADEKVLRPLLAGVQAKLRDLEGKRASSSTAPSRPSAPPQPAAKRARDDPPPRPAQRSWAPAPRDPGGENTTAVHRKSSPKPKAPKHDWSAGRNSRPNPSATTRTRSRCAKP